MRSILMTLVLVSLPALAADPVTLPDKYTPIFYEHLKGKEKDRCDKYVKELKVMETRKRLGAQPWELERMAAKRDKIEKDYDKFCLRWKPQ
ncbi:hypothetical protein [Chitinimonas sp. BJYL2]|uniref:hypothetical protein n=1 Tax=Chitinimonas sp. BJYL2 TaxID=2976696 RepID=UPI0022B4B02C|nr:hypothetical protein [Chitinimonas sp. BJYL2]